jgi:hypothetical protein
MKMENPFIKRKKWKPDNWKEKKECHYQMFGNSIFESKAKKSGYPTKPVLLLKSNYKYCY